MLERYTVSADSPDEVVRFPGVTADIANLGDWTAARTIQQPGWRWSKDVRPEVGTDWCEARHFGFNISGTLEVELADGPRYTVRPNDFFYVPARHDAWVVGDEPVVAVEWTGIRTFAGPRTGAADRVLATLLFTDLVSSTEIISAIGDARWRERLSSYFENARELMERFKGREIKTTGDGILATFEGPARALRCAAEMVRAAAHASLDIRVGVHVGEVEKVGDDVRGIAVHEAARIMSQAAAGEVLVSELTRALAQASDLAFEDRGVHRLKGLPGEWHLSALTTSG